MAATIGAYVQERLNKERRLKALSEPEEHADDVCNEKHAAYVHAEASRVPPPYDGHELVEVD